MTLGRLMPKSFRLGIEISSDTTGCGFHIVNNWFARLTRGLISLVNDNHIHNNFKETLFIIDRKSTTNTDKRQISFIAPESMQFAQSLHAHHINSTRYAEPNQTAKILISLCKYADSACYQPYSVPLCKRYSDDYISQTTGGGELFNSFCFKLPVITCNIQLTFESGVLFTG